MPESKVITYKLSDEEMLALILDYKKRGIDLTKPTRFVQLRDAQYIPADKIRLGILKVI